MKNDKTYEKIYVKDILYVEAMQNYIAFHTVNGKRHLALITMKQAANCINSSCTASVPCANSGIHYQQGCIAE